MERWLPGAQPNPTPPWEYRHPNRATEPMRKPPALTAKPNGRCSNKSYCKQIRDCAEARFYLNECGVKTLDGDGDGRPCESLCR